MMVMAMNSSGCLGSDRALTRRVMVAPTHPAATERPDMAFDPRKSIMRYSSEVKMATRRISEIWTRNRTCRL